MKNKVAAAISGFIVFLGVVLAGIVAVSVLLWLLQLAWNSVIPQLFGVPMLSYQQTAALVLLAILARLAFLPIPGSKGQS